jgi:hypothetical protein
MMARPDLDSAYEIFELFEGTIGKIHFCKKPDFQLLTIIAEQPIGTDPIMLSFDQTFPLGEVDEIAGENWSHQVKSACLLSDIFEEESHVWFEFSRMKRLTVQARLRHPRSALDIENLMAFQHAVSEGMPKLNELQVVLDCGEDAFQQAKSALNWPFAGFKWSVERGRFKSGGRGRKFPSWRRKTPA